MLSNSKNCFKELIIKYSSWNSAPLTTVDCSTYISLDFYGGHTNKIRRPILDLRSSKLSTTLFLSDVHRI